MDGISGGCVGAAANMASMMAGDDSRHINICSELLLESQHVWQELPLTFGNNYPLTPESLL